VITTDQWASARRFAPLRVVSRDPWRQVSARISRPSPHTLQRRHWFSLSLSLDFSLSVCLSADTFHSPPALAYNNDLTYTEQSVAELAI